MREQDYYERGYDDEPRRSKKAKKRKKKQSDSRGERGRRGDGQVRRARARARHGW